ncbi:MAG TPA: type II secretion system F family protein [Gemmatimonadaceae bacterium]|nr:type II secretion system F family protein [Gemmatimonadaceae bacterium]
MNLALGLLVSVLALALGVAAWTVRAAARRRAVLGRTDTETRIVGKPTRILIGDVEDTRAARAARVIEKLLPEGVIGDVGNERLLWAGFDGPAAGPMYAVARVISAAGVPVLLLLVAPRDTASMLLLTLGIGIAIGLLLPNLTIRQLAKQRAEKIRHSLPDCLDLLLVCVEAGVSLDAAILRVGREMATLHPELSGELMIVNRRTNAGMRREDALHGLYKRTGVEELRTLASSMIQSERWGSSIGKVLRVYSESLRRKRRQAAERKAAVAAAKMVMPLALLILPALFMIIGGPILMGLKPVLDAISQ